MVVLLHQLSAMSPESHELLESVQAFPLWRSEVEQEQDSAGDVVHGHGVPDRIALSNVALTVRHQLRQVHGIADLKPTPADLHERIPADAIVIGRVEA